MAKVAKIVPTRFVGVVMCIRKAILKWSMREISVLKPFGEYFSRSWTGRSERSSTIGTKVDGKQCVVHLDPFSAGRIGNIQAFIYIRE